MPENPGGHDGSRFKAFKDTVKDKITPAIVRGGRATGREIMAVLRPANFPRQPLEERDPTQLAQLAEERKSAMKYPTFEGLKANLSFQKWIVDPDTRPHPTFEAIRDGKPIPKDHIGRAQEAERKIDPDLDIEELKQKCVDYCKHTSARFIKNAADIADSFASSPTPPAEDELIQAMSKLMVPESGGEDSTIFKTGDWMLLDLIPDYKQLDVDLKEAGISEEKVMAGIGLIVGLWSRLADLNANFPSSSREFAQAMKEGGFSRLTYNTGWAQYTGNEEKYVNVALGSPEGTKEFYNLFKYPDFFKEALTILNKPEPQKPPTS